MGGRGGVVERAGGLDCYRQLVAELQPFRACNDVHVGRVEDLRVQRVSNRLRSSVPVSMAH